MEHDDAARHLPKLVGNSQQFRDRRRAEDWVSLFDQRQKSLAHLAIDPGQFSVVAHRLDDSSDDVKLGATDFVPRMLLYGREHQASEDRDDYAEDRDLNLQRRDDQGDATGQRSQQRGDKEWRLMQKAARRSHGGTLPRLVGLRNNFF